MRQPLYFDGFYWAGAGAGGADVGGEAEYIFPD
jgi:hypothetical protein